MAKQESSTVGSALRNRSSNLSVIKKSSDGRVTIVGSTQLVETDSAVGVRKCISTRPWDLTKPQYDDENYYRYRAQSILTGMEFQDGSKHAPILPVEQALDVVNWNWDTGCTL